jgi:hypothetical protein
VIALASGGVLIFVYLAFLVFEIAALWIVFSKAGRPGWAAIIPIYNLWVLLKIVGRPGWWIILFIIPLINLVIWIIVALDLARSFNKGTGFALGLIFFNWIFVPILAFGSAQYAGPSPA